MTPHRPTGLYEELVTRRLEVALEEIRGQGWRDEVEQLDPAEAPDVLARFVHDLVEPLLGSLTGEDRTARQLEIVNNLVDHLQSAVKNSPVLDDDALAPPPRQLLSLVDPGLHGERRILVSQHVRGSHGVDEWLFRFLGQPVRTPQLGESPPASDHINWHRNEVFREPPRTT